LLVQEIAELSRTFNVKLFSAVAVTAASYRVYGSLENMLDTALLKPLLDFDLSGSSLLYVLLRMPVGLRDKIPRAQLELEITNWFKEKTSLQSIHITEPIYTEDLTDRIDAVLFIGGFDTTKLFAKFEEKIEALKAMAVEKGCMTEDWQLPFKVEEETKPPEPEPPAMEELQPMVEPAQTVDLQNIEAPVAVEEPQAIAEAVAVAVETPAVLEQAPVEIPGAEAPAIEVAVEQPEAPTVEKPKRTRRTKKPQAEQPAEEAEPQKPKRTRRARKAQTAEKVE